mgnify:CR=1 FL=1
MKNKFTILGCGSSLGSPWITNYKGYLRKNPKNLRTRCCAHIQKGNLSILIDTSPDIKNQFLSKGIGLLVDSTPTEIIDSSLENELALMKSRHENAAMQYRSWADIAPAMGMIGTLCGLVGMLQNMSDPKAIGPAMAIALLTTLYGALVANCIAKPIAEKLEGYSKDESENCELIMEGIRGIQDGMNPRSMADLLATRLAPNDRAALEG